MISSIYLVKNLNNLIAQFKQSIYNGVKYCSNKSECSSQERFEFRRNLWHERTVYYKGRKTLKTNIKCIPYKVTRRITDIGNLDI